MGKSLQPEGSGKDIQFLTENDVTDYEELAGRVDAVGKKFDLLSAHIKQLEGGISEVAQFNIHIINYSKTQEIYNEYKKSRKKNKFHEEHADEITKHEVAKAAFDTLGRKPMPKVAQLSVEYA